MAQLPCIALYKPGINLPFGDCAMYFDHGVSGFGGISLYKPPVGVTSAEVAIICPEYVIYLEPICLGFFWVFFALTCHYIWGQIFLEGEEVCFREDNTK